MGTATLKVPPSWSAERNTLYSLRSWLSDVILWSSATDLDAVRQGPVAALQISGAARELIREIPPQHLRDGIVDPQTGQQVPGLMVLAQALVARYAPLDAENVTRAVKELMHFSRLPHEDMDSFLVRFDILRNRAAQRGGMALNSEGLSWILLNALKLSPEGWDRLLFWNDGHLPRDGAEMEQLMGRLRRAGHVREGLHHRDSGQGGVGDPGAYYFPSFSTPGPMQFDISGGDGANLTADASFHQAPHSADSFMPSAFPAWNMESDAAGQQCNACGCYFDDEDISSATESDDGQPDDDVDNFEQFVTIDGQERTDDAAYGDQLYHDYLMARKRWRRFAGKPPRRYRKFNRRPDRWQKVQGRFQRSPFGRSYASFLPQGSLAGGKGGKSKHKGSKGFGRKNPRGKDGQTLKCAKCGSDEHLWRQCPGGSGGNRAGGEPSSGTPNLSLHMRGDQSRASNMPHNSLAMVSANSMIPGVSFNYMMSGISGQHRSKASRSMDYELESLRSVASSRSKRRTSRASGSDGVTATEEDYPEPPQWEALVPGVATPKSAPPSQPPDLVATSPSASAEEDARRRTTLQLTQLLQSNQFDSAGHFPWWETSSNESPMTGVQSFHARTRIGGRVGLLVDPGAHDNLIGGATLHDMAQQLKVDVSERKLNNVLSVSGVGKSTQEAATCGSVRCSFKNFDGEQVAGSYTAPVIPQSTLPPLLGLKSLQAKKAILDTHARKLIIPGPGGVEYRLSPGTLVHQLEMSDSGHLILPLDEPAVSVEAEQSAKQSKHDQRLDFVMKCRNGRGQPSVAARSSE